MKSGKSKVQSQTKTGAEDGTAELNPCCSLPVEQRENRAFVEVDGVVVDVELDVLRHHRRIHFLRVPSDILAARGWVRECVFDAGAKRIVDVHSRACDQVAPDRNRCQRQRALHSRFPHCTEIFEQRQTLRLIRKSSLVDQHAAVHVPAQHGLLDPIEPHRHGVEPPEQIQQQRSRRALAWNGNAATDAASRARDDDRADAESGGASRAQKRVTIAYAVVCRDRDLRHVRFTAFGACIQRLDVVDMRNDTWSGTRPCTSA